MTPELEALYGVAGTWQEVIAAAVRLPPTLPPPPPDDVRVLRERNSGIARTSGVTLGPPQLAELVVDRSLVG